MTRSPPATRRRSDTRKHERSEARAICAHAAGLVQRVPKSTVWLAVGGFALAVRLAYLWEIHRVTLSRILVGDGRVYDAWAKEIVAGNWLGDTVFYQAPLYPYFLAAVYAVAGQSIIAVRFAQAVLGSAGCSRNRAEERQRAQQPRCDLRPAGRLDLAAQTFRSAIEADPQRRSSRENLALALTRAGRVDDAIREYEALLRLAPDDPQARSRLAELLTAVGR